MGELLSKALAGVDPGAPGAFWRIFANLMGLLPWWPLTIFTVVCVAVAVAIARYQGSRLGAAIGWALLLGPLAWPLLWARGQGIRPCPRCATPVPARRDRCPHCGRRMQTAPPAA